MAWQEARDRTSRLQLALAEDGRRRTGVQQPVREGVANPGGHAKKCKGLRDFLQGQGGRYRGRTAFALRRRATDLITKFAFAKTRRRAPVGWTPNCTVPLRETRSNGGPVEYRQVARLCGFEPRTPDHFELPRTGAYPVRGAGPGLRRKPGTRSDASGGALPDARVAPGPLRTASGDDLRKDGRRPLRKWKPALGGPTAKTTSVLRFHGGMVVAVYFATAPGRVRAAVWEMRVRLPLPPQLSVNNKKGPGTCLDS